jgi:hypothetical protein
MALICIGVVLILFFAVLYDTSVSDFTGSRVHNVGLMQNRLIGTLIGFGCLAVGITLALAGRKRK